MRPKRGGGTPRRSGTGAGVLPARVFSILALLLVCGPVTGVAAQTAEPRRDHLPCHENNEAQGGVGMRTIYGFDDRKDWYEVKEIEARTVAQASVALVPIRQTAGSPGSGDPSGTGGHIKFKSLSLRSKERLCSDEKFANQEAIAQCSGTLVAPDLILTAGHCVKEVCRTACGQALWLDEIEFVFGYRVADGNEAGPLTFPARQVYRATSTPPRSRGAVETETTANGERPARFGKDWALVKLDRPVDPEVAVPVTLDFAPVADHAKVYTVGYPAGLPMKLAGGATVRDNARDNVFVANLDTFAGSSGGGVFDQKTHRLIGIVVFGGVDYVKDTSARPHCRRACGCPDSGCAGEHVLRLSVIKQGLDGGN